MKAYSEEIVLQSSESFNTYDIPVDNQSERNGQAIGHRPIFVICVRLFGD